MRTSALAVLAAALLVLAGCSGDPRPKFEPTQSPTTASSSPTEQPQSAEDFIREWVELQTKMQTTGDVSEFLSASPGCRACHKVAELIESIYSEGGYVRTRGWRPLKFSCQRSGTRTSCDVRMTSSPTRYKEAAHAPLKRLPGGLFTEIFELSQVDGQWRVAFIAERAT